MKSKINKEKDKLVFSKETIDSLTKLRSILLRIHVRLINEGKAKVINGKIIFLQHPPTHTNASK